MPCARCCAAAPTWRPPPACASPGGHSIDDREPKYGLAVTGTVHPDRLVRNSTARAGDELWLTKPVGGGVASTAMKRGTAPAEVAAAAVEVMTTLNGEASRTALEAGATAMTDVTGFGLLGHLRELARRAAWRPRWRPARCPRCRACSSCSLGAEPPVAGGTRRNRAWIEEVARWAPEVPEERRWLLCDAMTSGGLLVAAPPGAGAPGVRIGRLGEGEAGRIDVSA